MLYFGVFAVLLAIYLFTRSNTIFSVIFDYYYINFLEYFILFLLVPFIVLFFENLFFGKIKKVVKYYTMYNFILAATLFFIPASIHDDILRIWQASMLVPLIYIIFFQVGYAMLKNIKELYRFSDENKSKFKKILFSVYTTIFKSISGNLFIGKLLVAFSAIFDILDSAFFATGIAFTKYGFFMFVMGIGVVLANKFLTVHNQVEELNTTLETKVRKRTEQLQDTLDKVQGLKQQQDGDYFLTTLLIQPLGVNQVNNENVQIDFLLKQKKQFEFKKWKSEIGGDLCIAYNITLKGREHTVFLNADAMGKSIQGGGGALVLGSVFQSIAERTKMSKDAQNIYPERWLKNAIFELHNIFLGFDGSMFISVVLGLIDNKNGMVYYVNAEHPWSILYRNNKAQFIEKDLVMRKLGTPGLKKDFRVETYILKDKDVLIMGSDGRDDLLTGFDAEGSRIINEDETQILNRVEEGKSNLDEIYKNLLDFGEITDDLSFLRLEYKADKPTVMLSNDIEKINEKLFQLKQMIDQNKTNDAIEICRSFKKMNITDSTLLKKIIKLSKDAKSYNEAAYFSEELTYIVPEEQDFLYMASFFYRMAGNTGKAIDLGERIHLTHAKNVKNLINLAHAYANSKNYKRATQLLNETLQIESENKRASTLLEKIKELSKS